MSDFFQNKFYYVVFSGFFLRFHLITTIIVASNLDIIVARLLYFVTFINDC
ncbi:MAG: hypothetical protein H6Q19_613 [Bacteroidetes bacterium]|nr:hypothetical protein [Bacteroidota bacterium]